MMHSRDPKRVFNCDEIGFPLDGNTGCIKAVLAAKGARHMMKRDQGMKMQITVLGCANAAGDFMAPYLVYPGQLMTIRMGYENFRDAIYTQTENGWMDCNCFFEFICYFNAYVMRLGIRRPVILWVDGHVSHLGAETARFCQVNDIILFVLLGNTTFIIQPFDVGIFSELKQAWVKAVCDYTKDDFSRLVMKGNFSHVFKMAWEEITGSMEKAVHIATNAFKRAGIFPFDPNEVDYSQLVAPLNSAEKETETIPECHPYTLSGSGIVDENEMVVEPVDAPNVPRAGADAPNVPRVGADAPNVPRVGADAPRAEAEARIDDAQPLTSAIDDAQPSTSAINDAQPSTSAIDDAQPSTSAINDAQPSTSAIDDAQPSTSRTNTPHGIGSVASSAVEPAQPGITNMTERRNNAILNDPHRVTEVDPDTGAEQIIVQPQVAVKTEDGQVIATVPAVMIPVKRGMQYVSEAAKKLKKKEEEVTRMLAEKNRKWKQGSENIRHYVTKAQSGNEALEYFDKKEEDRKRELQEKE